LFQFQNRREQVAMFFDALQNVAGFKGQQFCIFSFEGRGNFFPSDWRGNRRMLFRAQRINANGRFVSVVLAPVHKNFSAAQIFLHF
jgi:hypothetical protein